MLYIGVDLGTSSVKLLAMDENGDIKKIVVREYPLHFPKRGWAEQDPEDWFDAVEDGFEELTSDLDTSLIEGVSFSGQMHGLVLLDEKDEVIRPAILWNDGRTVEECRYLNEVIGQEVISSYTANKALTGFTAPKLLWVKSNEPENFAKIKKIMLPKDYIAYRLSGVHCTDVSDASGMLLLDVENKRWSKEMLEICDIKEEQLAKVYESYEVVRTITQEMSDRLNLPTSCKVIAGGGDQAVGAVGTGTVGNGMCSVSLGTSGVVFISSKNFAVDDANALHSFAHADGKYHFMGVTLAAAASNKWWMDEILNTKEYNKEQEGITVLGENHVFYLPYLMGERTPHNNPKARGTFIGMVMDTTREDMTQAVLEGVAYSLRDCFEITKSLGVNVERIRISGGGSKSKLWCSIIANVLDVKVDKINSLEGPGFGAAILAAVGCGQYNTVEEATKKLIKVVETTEQNPDIVKKYEESYKIYKELYPTLKGVYEML
ncbi:MAG TPA: xylulokinase [Clostridiales bacterium]|nr:xylulokinase [Clostridiales bacterium]